MTECEMMERELISDHKKISKRLEEIIDNAHATLAELCEVTQKLNDANKREQRKHDIQYQHYSR